FIADPEYRGSHSPCRPACRAGFNRESGGWGAGRTGWPGPPLSQSLLEKSEPRRRSRPEASSVRARGRVLGGGARQQEAALLQVLRLRGGALELGARLVQPSELLEQ